MDVPSEHEEPGLYTQLRLALVVLYALHYITRNARDRSGQPMLRTWVRITIVILCGMVMLFFDARPPSIVCSFRHHLFSLLPHPIQRAYKLVTVENAKKAMQTVLGISPWQTVQVICSHVFMIANDDLKPFINNRIAPFVNDNLKPRGKVLAEQVWRLVRNIIQWTGITDHLNRAVVRLEGTALHGFGVGLSTKMNALIANVDQLRAHGINMMNALVANMGQVWAYVLIALILCASALVSWRLFKLIRRGIMRAYAIQTAFKKGIVRILWTVRWVLYTLIIIILVLGYMWHMIIVKGEEHFGNRGVLCRLSSENGS